MKRHIALMATALLLCGGSYAQNTQPEKKPKAYVVADAHLDTQWNWDVQTTIKHHVWNTISQNLLLLKQYPDYIFNFEGGVKYAWMKEYYPAQYEEMKKYIREGRWHISGASWDANDVLVPSTESVIRNIMLGQEYYRQEFGVESTDIFLPDCFGFGWTLPTIAAHCGLIGFSSQKLDWRNKPFYGKNKYPFTIGLWKGIDGASIMFAHGYDYGKRWDDEDLSENKQLLELTTRTPLNMVYRYYGTGDIGGSPTIGSVRSVEKGIKGDGPLEVISATSDQLFKDFQPYDNHPELPVFNGELLMDVHGTGCYTSQAAMKLYNRQNELMGDAAERAAVTAEWLNQASYPGSTLSEAWKRFIYHQFHDDLTGTSIPRAYEFSWNDELISLKQFSNVLTSSIRSIAGQMDTRVKGTPVILYNALGFPVQDIAEVEITLPSAPKGITVYDMNGKKVAAQLLNYADGKAQLLIDASVPATGYAVYDIRTSGSTNNPVDVANHTIENSIYKITLDENGDICSLLDKINHKELVKQGKVIRLALFTENESHPWPAWEIIKETIDREPISITGNVKISQIENGNLRKTLCIEKTHGESVFKQYIRLYEGSRAERIDFYNEVDWQSTNALLKAEFPLNVENREATYDLGIGSVKRGNNTDTAYEVYAHYWADLTHRDNSYGVSFLNDSKYGWDKPNDHTLRLTLLHTPGTTHNYAYQDRQDYGHHCFTYSLIGHSGALDHTSTVEKAELMNQRLKAFQTDKHKGTLGKEFSFVTSNNRNVIIKAIKKAESSDEYVIRVYETGGKSIQQATLSFAGDILSANEADGTEKNIGNATFNSNQLQIHIKPYSIQTFKVRLKKSMQPDYRSEYANLSLNYDRKCASFNEFRGEANFESGYSYAAELLPDSIFINQVPFHLGEKDSFNGMTCKGDTILLPSGNTYTRLYFLAASASDNDCAATFCCGKSKTELVIPSYTGFIGQWGHTNHTKGYLKDAEIAYVGTHRHSSGEDHPYEFTYMFKFGIHIPKGATSIILPKNDKIVLFAATLANENLPEVTAASRLFRTAIKGNHTGVPTDDNPNKENLLKTAEILSYSGYANPYEKPEYMIDGNKDTKWCDTGMTPNYVDFDLGKQQHISGWKLINAGEESHSYVTKGCFLQGKNHPDEEWMTLDRIDGNSRNKVERQLPQPAQARYIRLLVTNPVQDAEGKDARIYEFEVYK